MEAHYNLLRLQALDRVACVTGTQLAKREGTTAAETKGSLRIRRALRLRATRRQWREAVWAGSALDPLRHDEAAGWPWCAAVHGHIAAVLCIEAGLAD